MHTSQCKIFKNRNMCDVTIESILTKSTISEKKNVDTIKESTKREKKLGRERERERERVLTFFFMTNLKGIRERGGNEVKRNL